MKKILTSALLVAFSQHALSDDTAENVQAAQVPQGLYIGGGLSFNSIDAGSIFSGADRETASGLQIFGGLPIPNAINGFETFGEVGYFQTSEFNFGGDKERVRGIWGAAVLQRDLNEIDPNLYALARVGVELGDDDGVFMGMGAGYRITPKVEVRAEFLNKDLLTSYQLNALVRF